MAQELTPSQQRLVNISPFWRSSPDWAGLLNWSHWHLSGNVDASPAYPEPLWDETQKIKSSLNELHKFGILTTNSQLRGSVYQSDGDERRDRPFLVMLVPTRNRPDAPEDQEVSLDNVDNFLGRLLACDAIYTDVQYQYRDNPQNRAMSAGQPRFQERSNFPQHEVSPSTDPWAKYRFGSTQVRGGDTWECTEWSQVIKGSALGDTPDCKPGNIYDLSDNKSPFPASYEADPLQITIVAKRWDSDVDLQELVKQTLVEEGFEPVFELSDVSSGTSSSQGGSLEEH